jgi:glycosyltransferase involved in cell wall biosynthesis
MIQNSLTISVVMPTYNTPTDILREAVESILHQTYGDFEFIIIDDGSTNNSVDYLNSLKDKRIRLIRNPENVGITKSLNIGLRAAQGRYIARMDGDDVALPNRFQKQVAFMERHPDVIVCGSACKNFGADTRLIPAPKTNIDMETYRISALFRNPGPMHPTAFLNHALLLKHGLQYDESLPYAQDYGLWVEVGKTGRVCMLKDTLLLRRVHKNQVSGMLRKDQIRCDMTIQGKLLRDLLGTVTAEEADRHFRFSSGYYDVPICPEMTEWYRRLAEANDRVGIYDRKKFKRFIDNTIIKQAVIRSFTPEMPMRKRVGRFFHYLPGALALKASAGYIKRELTRRLRKQ